MKLIGMLDSPYVRRVAVSARLMGVALDHEPVSVFRHMDRFAAINPLIKAPTLVCDDGGILMDSSLILDHLESGVEPSRRLMPGGAARQQALYRTGVALVATEKAVQLYYEIGLRPADKRWDDWITRIVGQMERAFGLLESELATAGERFGGDRLDAADIATAVAWRFIHFVLPGKLDIASFPHVKAHSERAEAMPEFSAFPLD